MTTMPMATTTSTKIKRMSKQEGGRNRPLSFLTAKTNVLRRIAGRPAALPQNCLTTEDESRIGLSFRPRHFGNNFRAINISFLDNHLPDFAT
jgi:hypothetical protein